MPAQVQVPQLVIRDPIVQASVTARAQVCPPVTAEVPLQVSVRAQA
ncbi:hypothetical protein [Enterococcus avium]|nr:hypothetical protein [Enterococcus avium]